MSITDEKIQKLKFSGAVDADGHILEDAGLWDRYIEAKYKDRALRTRLDSKGQEYLEVAGRPSKIFHSGRLGGLSAMGTTRDDKWQDRPTYGGMAPFGALLGGALADRLGAPLTLAIGAVACMGAALLFGIRLPSLRVEGKQLILAQAMAGGEPSEEMTARVVD